MPEINELNIIKLVDYVPPVFITIHHDLCFDLQDTFVRVVHQQTICRYELSESKYQHAYDSTTENLQLNSENLNLIRIAIDGMPLEDERYCYQDNLLTIYAVPERFILETEVHIYPDDNQELSGLYRSNGIYCTQCEAEGFRRISFAFDRPDVLATYRVRIEGDKSITPIMLSNGNLEEQGVLPNGRHYVCWYDPFPKPSYLFALVAGKLSYVSQQIITSHGKKVALYIYTEDAYISQVDYAMQSLINAFNWDEERFNLSYDLERFNLVAVSDFNMGAMENKSLNIFNTKYVLSDIHTATDADFLAVQSVVGHEYFHNWTGNRITCRDWFQLSLKEGLTVFREHEFAADMNVSDIERIRAVGLLRRTQFPEDAGPMRHPVQPQAYAAIDNFYTATVYEKGAEIIRMYHTILGEETFQKGMALYIERHDGQAVRIEDFAQCMQDASGFPFREQFFDWYTTAGTPKLNFTSSYRADTQEFILSVRQDVSALTPAHPLLIPIRIALIDSNGQAHRFDDGSMQRLLLLEKEENSWSFTTTNADVIPVLMTGFSAPVYYHYDYSNEALTKLVLYAPDGFARYEAMQSSYRLVFLSGPSQAESLEDNIMALISLMRGVLEHQQFTSAEKALLLHVPTFEELLPYLTAPIDMDKTLERYQYVTQMLAENMRDIWQNYLENETTVLSPAYSVHDAGIRALRGIAMKMLGKFGDAYRHSLFLRYQQANCMTERMNALEALNLRDDDYRDSALSDFYQRFAHQPLVIDKWFALQARDYSEGAFNRIQQLAEHPDYSTTVNPNRFRAFIASFMGSNPILFHQRNGDGYRFAMIQIRRIICSNPQLAARLLSYFAIVSQLDNTRRAIVANELDAVSTIQGLSKDVREVIMRITRGLL